MAIKYNSNGKIIAKRFTIKQLEKADNDCAGYCLACGHRQQGVESDASKYICESCKKPFVYGAGEIAMKGLTK